MASFKDFELYLPCKGLCNNYQEERGRGAEKLELSSKNLDSTPPPKQKELVLTPFCYVKNNITAAAGLITLTLTLFSSDITKVESNNRLL